MIRTFRYAFVLAKVYGIISKSFLGDNFKDILRLRRVQELFDMLYPGERTEAPEVAVSSALEIRVAQSARDSMIKILDLFPVPEPILVHMLRRCEYQTVKSVLRAARTGVSPSPRACDLGRYASIDFASFRDPLDALANSRFAWIITLAKTFPAARLENMLDKEYYTTLEEMALSLPRPDRKGVARLVRLEIELASVIWALRLRFFFGMAAEEARELLIAPHGARSKSAASAVFDIQSDSIEDWRRWRFAWLIEDQLAESFTAPDPVRAQQKASHHLYERARHLLHQDPFTLTPVVAFFMLKEHEAAILKTAVEALRLSVAGQEVLALVGAR